MSNIITFTIPKNCDINHKLITSTKDEFAYNWTKKKPKQDFNTVVFIHKNKSYFFTNAWWDEEYGICFNGYVGSFDTDMKGFQGFRYIYDAIATKDGVKYEQWK